jgi:hypothetical protein
MKGEIFYPFTIEKVFLSNKYPNHSAGQQIGARY